MKAFKTLLPACVAACALLAPTAHAAPPLADISRDTHGYAAAGNTAWLAAPTMAAKSEKRKTINVKVIKYYTSSASVGAKLDPKNGVLLIDYPGAPDILTKKSSKAGKRLWTAKRGDRVKLTGKADGTRLVKKVRTIKSTSRTTAGATIVHGDDAGTIYVYGKKKTRRITLSFPG
ncbi:hypothetical protein [Rarobacter incanus]|uniref:DUF5666 domain-containing protein n=1 Tax=Rarobacter incanus TaxID=153494 RepID=A0A542SQC4_9MICO|nr:hypothetical protein [Rarobacter incanus]TQK76802.1 hypothetical protein FB389_1493 [Rarobacter incanus]